MRKKNREIRAAAVELADALSDWIAATTEGRTTDYPDNGFGVHPLWSNHEWQRVTDAKFLVWRLTR